MRADVKMLAYVSTCSYDDNLFGEGEKRERRERERERAHKSERITTVTWVSIGVVSSPACPVVFSMHNSAMLLRRLNVTHEAVEPTCHSFCSVLCCERFF